MSEEDRIVGRAENSAVCTGGYAINPVNGERIPVWIADYVLTSYGTGAIMAVPGHDQRDFEFARKFHLPIRAVVLPPDSWLEPMRVSREDYAARVGELASAFTDDGPGIRPSHSGLSLNGPPTPEAK